MKRDREWITVVGQISLYISPSGTMRVRFYQESAKGPISGGALMREWVHGWL